MHGSGGGFKPPGRGTGGRIGGSAAEPTGLFGMPRPGPDAFANMTQQPPPTSTAAAKRSAEKYLHKNVINGIADFATAASQNGVCIWCDISRTVSHACTSTNYLISQLFYDKH